MKIHAEVEPVYIVGDFSVKSAEKGWIIEAPASDYSTGSWKTQGLPFYSWGITYSKEFNIEKSEGKWKVRTGQLERNYCRSLGKRAPARSIAFPPYQTDVTGLIKPGLNKIEVKVIGSLKNLLGPSS